MMRPLPFTKALSRSIYIFEFSELRERYTRFNVEELKRVTAESVGAKSCIEMTKLGEGGYNKAFKLIMDNGAVAIARIPCPNAGPGFKTTASEVATMDFARRILNIPVPKIHSWSGVKDNPVEAEYIVLEEAAGTSLADAWQDMTIRSKNEVVRELVSIEKKLLSVSFSRYGSIYFEKDSFTGCERAKICNDAPTKLKNEIEERYVIGPVVGDAFWKGERSSMPLDRGPWKAAHDYLKCIADNEIKCLALHPDRKQPLRMFGTSEAQNSPEAHVELYRKYLDVSPNILPEDERMTRSTLWHWDMRAPNIFVKDNRITGLIDWQSVWAGPLFLQYWPSKLARYTGEMMLRLPDDYESLEKTEQEKVANKVERSILKYVHDTETKKQNPLIVELNAVPHRKTRKQTVAFAEDTWEDDILPFRQCLIRLERHWDELGFDGPCPIHFTEQDIENHMRDGDGWNEVADMWDSLEGIVGRDGWTTNENYLEAFKLFASFREDGLKETTGEERENFERATRWASGDPGPAKHGSV